MSTHYGEESLQSTIDVARELFSNYETFRFRAITSRRFGQAELLEWLHAIKANDPSKALSNFDYAGPFTEAVLRAPAKAAAVTEPAVKPAADVPVTVK